MHEKVRIDHERCDGCRACISHCPKGPRIFEIADIHGRRVCVVMDTSYCLGCTNCLTHCKNAAIELWKSG